MSAEPTRHKELAEWLRHCPVDLSTDDYPMIDAAADLLEADAAEIEERRQDGQIRCACEFHEQTTDGITRSVNTVKCFVHEQAAKRAAELEALVREAMSMDCLESAVGGELCCGKAWLIRAESLLHSTEGKK